MYRNDFFTFIKNVSGLGPLFFGPNISLSRSLQCKMKKSYYKIFSLSTGNPEITKRCLPFFKCSEKTLIQNILLWFPGAVSAPIIACFIYVSRRFYPKRLIVHSGYTSIISMCSLGIEPTTFNAMLDHWATGTQVFANHKAQHHFKVQFLFIHLLPIRAFESFISRGLVCVCILFIDACINGYIFCVYVYFFPDMNRINQLMEVFERFILTVSHHWPCQLTFTGAPLHSPRFSRANTRRAREPDTASSAAIPAVNVSLPLTFETSLSIWPGTPSVPAGRSKGRLKLAS